MALTTPRWAIPYPQGADVPDVPAAMLAMATVLDGVAMDDQGTLASRPVSSVGSPGKKGRYYQVRGDADPTQNGRLWRDNGTGWDEIVTNVPVVTALPSSPYDGQEIRYLADATNGVVWHLKYRAASASAYKWEFVGGGTLYNGIDAAEFVAGNSNNAYGDGVTVGPAITVPLAGDYEYDFGCSFYGDTGIPTFKVCPNWAGTPAIAPNDTDCAEIFPPNSGAWGFWTLGRKIKKTGRPAAEAVTLKYNRYGVSNVQIRGRWLAARPIRVG